MLTDRDIFADLKNLSKVIKPFILIKSLIIVEPLSCSCENTKTVHLHIRGLCPKSYIDTYVMPKNTGAVGGDKMQYILSK